MSGKLREEVARAICRQNFQNPDEMLVHPYVAITGNKKGHREHRQSERYAAWTLHERAADAAIRLIAEECAKVAEEFVGNGTTMYQTGAAVCARNIATRIRSLADKETT